MAAPMHQAASHEFQAGGPLGTLNEAASLSQCRLM
jgi:hypothetical protein